MMFNSVSIEWVGARRRSKETRKRTLFIGVGTPVGASVVGADVGCGLGQLACGVAVLDQIIYNEL